MTTATRTIEELANREYQYGFVTDVEADTVPKGLNEEVVRLISEKKPYWYSRLASSSIVRVAVVIGGPPQQACQGRRGECPLH